MTLTDLTTARWELSNKASGLSPVSLCLLTALLNEKIGYPAPNLRVEPGTPSKPITPLPDLTGKAKIALCIGHARANDSGAVAYNGVSEEVYNNIIAIRTKKRLEVMGYKVEIINFYPGNGYSSAMVWLARYLKDNSFTHAFELHFNSAGPTAKGFEYLYWHKSTKGIVMAEIFQALHSETFLDKSNRGAEALGDEAHERGVLFTSITHCPSIILEPFFGSNKQDAESYMTEEGKDKLSNFYSVAINKCVQVLAKT